MKKICKGVDFCRVCRKLCTGHKYGFCWQCNRPICPKCEKGDDTVDVDGHVFCGDGCANAYTVEKAQRQLEGQPRTIFIHDSITIDLSDVEMRVATETLKEHMQRMSASMAKFGLPKDVLMSRSWPKKPW